MEGSRDGIKRARNLVEDSQWSLARNPSMLGALISPLQLCLKHIIPFVPSMEEKPTME